jgi:hypothetical protein
MSNNNLKMINIILSDREIKLWIAYTMRLLFTFKNREVFLPHPVHSNNTHSLYMERNIYRTVQAIP